MNIFSSGVCDPDVNGVDTPHRCSCRVGRHESDFWMILCGSAVRKNSDELSFN